MRYSGDDAAGVLGICPRRVFGHSDERIPGRRVRPVGAPAHVRAESDGAGGVHRFDRRDCSDHPRVYSVRFLRRRDLVDVGEYAVGRASSRFCGSRSPRFSWGDDSAAGGDIGPSAAVVARLCHLPAPTASFKTVWKSRQGIEAESASKWKRAGTSGFATSRGITEVRTPVPRLRRCCWRRWRRAPATTRRSI